MKNLFIKRFAVVAFLVAPFLSFLVFDAQAAAPNYDVTGSYIVDHTCTFGCPPGPYAHDMILTQDGLGNLTGSGGSPAGSNVYTWVITSGSVSGSTISFSANYTATPDAVTPQTILAVTGTIAPGGTMSGTWTDNYAGGSRGGTWTTTSGLATPALIVDDNDLDCPGAPYTTIQAAVNAANSGDTITVCAGTYPENVTIAKPLTLSGSNMGVAGNSGGRVSEAIVDGGGLSSAIEVHANDVKVDGFTIKGGGPGAGVGSNSGIWSTKTNTGLQILNNIITDNVVGAFPECGGSCLVQYNLFDANNRSGASGGTAIYAEATNGLTVNANEFKGHSINNPILFATTVATSPSHVDLAFTNNLIHDNPCGCSAVYVLGVSGGAFSGNDITSDGSDLRFGGGNSSILVTKNILHSTVGVNVVDDGYGLGLNTGIVVNRNSLTGHSVAGVDNSQPGQASPVDATCNWWGAANGPGPVGTGSGDPVSTGVTFQPWLTTSDLVSGPCDGAPAPDVTVTIDKYIDGVQATAGNANGSSFPMQTTYSAANIGSGTDVPFSIGPVGFNSPNAYEAITSNMTSGANYKVSEVTGGDVVGATCADGKPFALAGYSTGDTLAEAQSNTLTATIPDFTNITTNKFVIVWNVDCSSAVTGMKWDDTNGNGTRDLGEPPLPNWEIALRRVINEPVVNIPIDTQLVQLSLTGLDGSFTLHAPTTGHYIVTETAQTGWQQTAPAGPDSFFDVFIDPGDISINTGHVHGCVNADVVVVTCPPVPLEFGNFKLITVTVQKNVVDKNETDVNDAHVFKVTLDGGPEQNISEGSPYLFENVGPGSHALAEITGDPDFDLLRITNNTNTLENGEFIPMSGKDMTLVVTNKQKPKVTVTIVKYIDGQHATATTANSSAFPMAASWNAANLGGAGTGTYNLSTVGFNNPSAYEATTSDMTNGASYSTNELTDGAIVGATCVDGKPFALVGYTTGDTLAGALAGTPSAVIPSLTNITTNKFIIVWNKDCRPKLTVIKTVINDNGGTKVVSNFPLFVDGNPVTSGVQAIISTPGTHTVSETNQTGYTGAIGGDCAANGSITLAPGDVKTCTIINDDNAPSLTLNKIVINDNGGTKLESAWTLTATGPTPISGPGAAGATDVQSGPTFAAGTYGLSEAGPAGYFTSGFSCVKNGGPAVLGSSISLNLGDTATCTIINNDAAPPPANACSLASVPGYTLQNGTAGNDSLIITPFTMFVGNGGNDTVVGLAGNFIVCTGSGNDVITLGAGISTIDAGNGNNIITKGSGAAVVYAGTGNDKIITGSGNDIVSAGNGKNIISTGAGNDTITSGSGNDFVDGGAGTDSCSAGGGVNTVVNCP